MPQSKKYLQQITLHKDPSMERHYGDFKCRKCSALFHYSPRFPSLYQQKPQIGFCQSCALETIDHWIQHANSEIKVLQNDPDPLAQKALKEAHRAKKFFIKIKRWIQEQD